MQKEWLTKNEAADMLGLGLRRTLDLAHQGVLKTTKQRDPLTHQMAVRFHAGDIERYLELRRTPAKAAGQLINVRDAVLADLRPTPEAAAALETIKTKTALEEPRGIDPAYLASFARELQQPTKALNPQRPWLTVDEAVEYTGWPLRGVMELIENGQLRHLDFGRGTRGGRYRIKRADLDALEGGVSQNLAAIARR